MSAPAQESGASAALAGAAPVAVKPLFNQLGFMPGWEKQVFLASSERDSGSGPYRSNDIDSEASLNLYEWTDPSTLAMSYLLWHPGLKDQSALANVVRPRFLQRAKALSTSLKSSGWRIANANFGWGSNKMTVEEGIVLCRAYEIGGNPEYLAAARDPRLEFLRGALWQRACHFYLEMPHNAR